MVDFRVILINFSVCATVFSNVFSFYNNQVAFELKEREREEEREGRKKKTVGERESKKEICKRFWGQGEGFLTGLISKNTSTSRVKKGKRWKTSREVRLISNVPTLPIKVPHKRPLENEIGLQGPDLRKELYTWKLKTPQIRSWLGTAAKVPPGLENWGTPSSDAVTLKILVNNLLAHGLHGAGAWALEWLGPRFRSSFAIWQKSFNCSLCLHFLTCNIEVQTGLGWIVQWETFEKSPPQCRPSGQPNQLQAVPMEEIFFFNFLFYIGV